MADRLGEEFAKSAFRSHLNARGIATAWRNGREPPDYYMRTRDARFGVEVTRAMESLSLGGVVLPTRAIRLQLERIPKKIQARAGSDLAGTYVMHLAPINDWRHLQSGVELAALDYIRATRGQQSAARLTLATLPAGRTLSIEKLSDTGTYIGAGYVLADPKRSPQVVSEVRTLIDERMSVKRLRLRRLRLPRVLLLVDSYGFAESAEWKKAAATLAFDGFHTVARVAGDSQCDVLHSIDARWRAKI